MRTYDEKFGNFLNIKMLLMGYRRWHKVHEPHFVSKLHATSKATKQTNERPNRTEPNRTEFSSMKRRSSMENCRKLYGK